MQGDEVTVSEHSNSGAQVAPRPTQPKSRAPDVATALRSEVDRAFPPPPATTGVFARAIPHDRMVPENREGRAMRGLIDELDKRLRAVEERHHESGARIEAWQELPKESAVAVAEARSIAALVEQEIGAIEALRSAVARALHGARADELAPARKRLEGLRDEVDRWHRDAQADRNELLVHGRAHTADAHPAHAAGADAPASTLALPALAQKVMADAIERRRAAEGNDDATRALIAEDQRTQVDLEKRLGAALQAARDAMVTEGVGELMSALDAVRAWGHSLAFEARRLRKP